MEVIECIRRDRATRSFTDEPVTQQTVTKLIDAARRAGSGKNRQPWSFIAVQDRDRLDDLATFGQYTTPLTRAPLAIVVLVKNRDPNGPRLGDAMDCGRAFQNLKLAVTAHGLGGVPQTVDSESAGELLNVPDDLTVLIALAIGHPAGPDDTIEGVPKSDVLESPARKPVSELLHWEQYS